MDSDRPSTFWAGVSLSLAVLSRMVYVDAQAGHYRDPGLYVAAALFCLSTPTLLWNVLDYADSAVARWRKWRTPPVVPAKTAAPVVVAPAVDVTAEQRAYATAIERFFRAGANAGGFSIRKLEGVVGSDTWARMVTFFASADGGCILIDKGANVGYQFNHGQTLDGVLLALGIGKLPTLPGPVPDVQPYIAHAQNAPQRTRQSATAPKIVEHEPRKVEA